MSIHYDNQTRPMDDYSARVGRIGRGPLPEKHAYDLLQKQTDAYKEGLGLDAGPEQVRCTLDSVPHRLSELIERIGLAASGAGAAADVLGGSVSETGSRLEGARAASDSLVVEIHDRIGMLHSVVGWLEGELRRIDQAIH